MIYGQSDILSKYTDSFSLSSLNSTSMEGKILVKNPHGSSKVWKHFGFYKAGNKVLKDFAVCFVCKQECKYSGGTTNLSQHIEKHREASHREASQWTLSKLSIYQWEQKYSVSDYFIDEAACCKAQNIHSKHVHWKYCWVYMWRFSSTFNCYVIYVKTEKEKIQTSTYELVNQELEKYDAEPQIRGDPLQWWKSREASMPILAKVARAILCVPGSSVPSERVFSKSGQLLNKKRASLKSKNVDMLIFLNKNYPFKHSSK